MSWSKETYRAYSREYAASLRMGCDTAIARSRARQAVHLGRKWIPTKDKTARPLTRAALGIDAPGRPIVPPDILADAERFKHMEHPTLVGRLMGDPLPGRSALDVS